MSKYTAAQIKNWNVDTETPSRGWIPARPLNPTGIITRCRHALGVLTGRYDVLDWEQEARMTDRQSTHSHDCCGCGPKHYEYEVWQDGVLQAGGREADYASAKSEASHYAAMYTPDGPVEVRIYEKRLLSAVQQPAEQRSQPKHSPYNSSGSLSEYGVFPECDAQQPADDEVVFIDGVGAGRSSIKSCHNGVQWIRVGNRVYWPLSDSDAKRLQSACCGNGSFDGPATPASEGEQQ